MKALLVLRHVKSSWEHSGLRDFERPLNPRGKRDGPNVGRFIRETEKLPDFIYCSPAKRTRQTLKLISQKWPSSPSPHFEKVLYEGDYSKYVKLIKEAPDTAERLLIIGHNPKVENLIKHLLQLGTGSRIRMPTGALACIKLDINSWKDLRQDNETELKWLITPKLLIKPEGFPAAQKQ